jgi:trimeric autotransporter adhesin
MKNLLIVFLVSLIYWPTHAQIITTVVGRGGTFGDGGPATNAAIAQPFGIFMANNGNLYIADAGHNRIRMVNIHGIITTVAGISPDGLHDTGGYNGDNIQATAALLKRPTGITADGAGNIYIVDDDNFRIRRIDPTGIITTIAGTGISGYSGDNGPATNATIGNCASICLDAAGNIYFADIDNFVIRKINTSGIINTYAGTGTGGYSGDGNPATAAKISTFHLCSDNSGNIYTAEYSSHCIRKIDRDGIITTIAGTGIEGYTPDGNMASGALLSLPSAVRVDITGNILFTEGGNFIVRKIAADGTLVTVAGDRTPGYSGDGGPATDAQLDAPIDVLEDLDGGIYICDFNNNVVQYISNPLGVATTYSSGNALSIYPTPCTGEVLLNITEIQDENVVYRISDMEGRPLKQLQGTTNKAIRITLDEPAGIFIVAATTSTGKVYNGRIVIQ